MLRSPNCATRAAWRVATFQQCGCSAGEAEGRLFGKSSLLVDEPNIPEDEITKIENKRFTRRWHKYEIAMDGDKIWDATPVDRYRLAGYPIGLLSTDLDACPFKRKGNKTQHKADFGGGALLKNEGIGWTLRLPGFDEATLAELEIAKLIYEFDIPEMGTVGAGMLPHEREAVDQKMTFLPEVPLPEIFGV